MMKSLLIACFVSILSLGAMAQGAPPPNFGGMGQQPSPEQQAMMQKQMRVMQAQAKALQDPALQKDLKALQKIAETEMLKIDPKTKTALDRMKVIEADMMAMQKSGNIDQAKGMQYMQEAQKLAMSLQPVQQKAMEIPHVKKAFAAFEVKVKAKMASIDAEVPKLIKELEAANPGMKK